MIFLNVFAFNWMDITIHCELRLCATALRDVAFRNFFLTISLNLSSRMIKLMINLLIDWKIGISKIIKSLRDFEILLPNLSISNLESLKQQKYYETFLFIDTLPLIYHINSKFYVNFIRFVKNSINLSLTSTLKCNFCKINYLFPNQIDKLYR